MVFSQAGWTELFSGDAERRQGPSGRWLGQLGSVRYQYLGAIALAVLVPVFLRWGFDLDGWLLEQQVNTIIASALAIFIGLLALRQLTNFPGVRESYYLLPALLVSFLLIFAVMLFGRIEYNRFLFPSSFAITIVWVFVAQSVSRPYRPQCFAIVPGGEPKT